jgi:signal transduction histidine kinase
MRRSLFTRYITVFMLIIFISFSILALIIGSNMTAMTVENKRQSIDHSAENISGMITNLYKPVSADDFKQKFSISDDGLSGYAKHLSDVVGDVRVYLIDADGKMILPARDYESKTFKKDSLPRNLLSQLKSDKSLSGYDDMNGTLFDTYLYGIRPVMAYSAEGDSSDVVGYIFSCTAEKGVNKIIGSTIKTLLLTSLWVFFAALVAVYFLTERIIGPLKNMSRAAKSYATGNFDIRIPVQGSDEVAELAVAFNQMADGMQSIEEMRRSFLANVSHDLKTPMTAIAGFIDGILSGAIPPENQTEYLERIKNEVLRLSRLVRQLLDISRIQAGDRKLEISSFDICEMARQIVLSFENRIDEKKLQVEFDCDEDNILVNADKDSIHQVLYNLCDNAVKFSREGGVYKVGVNVKNKKAHVSVYNEGQGIPSDDLPFVFERFYKSDKSRGLDKTGVGLGLYISKTIIDAHRETITVDSVAGQYCVFEFTLPVCEIKKPLIEKTVPKD